jgi:hypothetical protein
MILDFLFFVEEAILPINFISHITLFFGGFYIALHSRILPRWVVTCLWYIGLAGALNATTILLDWIYGPTFELAYSQIGMLTESILNFVLAVTVGLLFVHTLYKDFKGMKQRQSQEEKTSI